MCYAILVLMGLGTFSVIASDPTIAAKIQFTNGGDTMTVISGGTLAIESGGTYSNANAETFASGSTLTIPTGVTLAVASGATFTDATTSTLSGTKNVTTGGVLNIATGASLTVASGGTLSVADGATTTFSGAVTFTGATTTIDTGDTLAVTTADKLTVGAVIVPQTMIVPFHIPPHASLLTDTLFYAQTDGWTVTGVVVIMDLVDSTGGVTASICKATGNNLAVAATTPLHTGTFDMSGIAAGTPQVGTLTATGADLVLAATNKIGIVFSAALDTGSVSGYIKLKRS